MDNTLDRNDTELIREDTLHAGYFRMVRLCLRHRLYAGGWSEACYREVVLHGKVAAIIPYDPIRDTVALFVWFLGP